MAALVAGGLDPCETLVLFAADHGIEPAYMQRARGWTRDEWSATVGRLVARGLVDTSSVATASGIRLRRWVEGRTDSAAMLPWTAVGPERTDRLAELLTPLARRIAEANDVMRVNPMALDVPRELAG